MKVGFTGVYISRHVFTTICAFMQHNLSAYIPGYPNRFVQSDCGHLSLTNEKNHLYFLIIRVFMCVGQFFDCLAAEKKTLEVNMSRAMRKPDSAYAKTKAQISFAVTAKLISAFVFATRIVQ